MTSTQSLKIQDEKLSSLGLSKAVVNKEQVVCYSRGLENVSEKNPVLVLIHGYPESSYMWRHIVPLLSKDAPIFAPDLPGYGASPPIPQNDKLTVGNALMSALQTEVGRHKTSSSTTDIPVVLIGHDRGARIAHRVAVSGFEGVKVQGACLIDIVPTSVQWQAFRTASHNAQSTVGFFHWSFLANTELANKMITAYGGAKWCVDMIDRWAGSNTQGLEHLKSDHAMEVYGGFMTEPDVIAASCEDYKHGATTDVEAQEKDQKEGKKIGVPVLLLYGKDFIGKKWDMAGVWREWVGEEAELSEHGFGDGIGHFGAEEAPEECARVLRKWVERLR